jgi:hypothetical protein
LFQLVFPEIITLSLFLYYYHTFFSYPPPPPISFPVDSPSSPVPPLMCIFRVLYFTKTAVVSSQTLTTQKLKMKTMMSLYCITERLRRRFSGIKKNALLPTSVPTCECYIGLDKNFSLLRFSFLII